MSEKFGGLYGQVLSLLYCFRNTFLDSLDDWLEKVVPRQELQEEPIEYELPACAESEPHNETYDDRYYSAYSAFHPCLRLLASKVVPQ